MAQHEIRIEKHSYLPRRQAIAKGDTVVWLNNDPVAHTVTADDGSFDSGQLESKQTFSHTFEQAGTIGYHCDNHEKMKGTVAVDQKGQTHEIRIEKHSYLPSEQSVAKGDTVEWFNNDPDAHTVTADDGSFDSGQLESKQTFSHTFDTGGIVSYHCDNHGNMKGTITVEQGGQTHEVRIEKHSYLPRDQSIAKGDTVLWLNNDPDNHTVSADDGSFDSGQLKSKQTFSHTFDTAGIVSYHCDNHGNMQGAVIVGQKPRTHTIEITAVAFPTDTAISKGDTVEWINRMGGHPHTVTADNGEFDSGVFSENEKFSHVFDTAGTFRYHCEIHSSMSGKVTVT